MLKSKVNYTDRKQEIYLQHYQNRANYNLKIVLDHDFSISGVELTDGMRHFDTADAVEKWEKYYIEICKAEFAFGEIETWVGQATSETGMNEILVLVQDEIEKELQERLDEVARGIECFLQDLEMDVDYDCDSDSDEEGE